MTAWAPNTYQRTPSGWRALAIVPRRSAMLGARMLEPSGVGEEAADAGAAVAHPVPGLVEERLGEPEGRRGPARPNEGAHRLVLGASRQRPVTPEEGQELRSPHAEHCSPSAPG